MMTRKVCPSLRSCRWRNRLSRLFALMVWLPFCLSAGEPVDVPVDRDALRHLDPESALGVLQSALDEYRGQPISRARFKMLEARIEILRDLGRIEEARSEVRVMEALAGQIRDPILQGRASRMNGTLLAESGDIAAAMEAFLTARLFYQEAGDSQGELAAVTGNIGTAYAFVGEYERAWPYFKESVELARGIGDELRELRALTNLALVTSRLEGSEAGLPFQRQALALAEERGETDLVIYQLGGLCSSLIGTGNEQALAEAEAVCQRALRLTRRSGHARPMAEIHLHLGNLRLAQDRIDEALKEFELALELSEDTIPTIALEAHQQLAKVNDMTGDHATALQHHRRMVNLREEMFAEERRQMVAELDARYQLGERMQRIERLQVEAELKALQLQRRTWVLIGLAAALALTLALVLMAWRGYLIKSRLESQLAARNRELEQALATISKLAREDPLTGLINRRAFVDIANREMARSKRIGTGLVLAIGDIDYFKRVNDQHGHQAGDEVLVELATRLKAGLREVDVVGRWGGEEFMLLLPDATPDDAVSAIERLRHAIAHSPVQVGAHRLNVTMTFGVAPVGDDLEVAMRAGDDALYQGKAAGRNRVVLATDK